MAHLNKFTVQESLNTDTAASWDVQSVITVDSSADSTNVTSYTTIGIHTDAEIYFNFSSTEDSLATGTALKLAAGLTFLKIPKGVGSTIYFVYQRVSGDATMRLVLM